MAVYVSFERKNAYVGVISTDFSIWWRCIKTRLKQKLVDEFNLHTIIRLPHSVFAPYTGIHTHIFLYDKTKKRRNLVLSSLDARDL